MFRHCPSMHCIQVDAARSGTSGSGSRKRLRPSHMPPCSVYRSYCACLQPRHVNHHTPNPQPRHACMFSCFAYGSIHACIHECMLPSMPKLPCPPRLLHCTYSITSCADGPSSPSLSSLSSPSLPSLSRPFPPMAAAAAAMQARAIDSSDEEEDALMKMADLQGPIAKRAKMVLDIWRSLAKSASTPSTILPTAALQQAGLIKPLTPGMTHEDEPASKKIKTN
mmetsp:Transcript_20538/g.61226  ORF Transcript_20538/g.61226 Transcript_20538/m.61226 type:complete len:223 (-) Transcript_20538:1576-2244(-)